MSLINRACRLGLAGVLITGLLTNLAFCEDFIGDGFSALGRSMGGAMMATKICPEALLLNPAAVAGIGQSQLQAAYNNQWNGNVSEYFVAAAMPLGAWTVAGALPLNVVSDIPRTQENIDSGEGERIGSINQFYSAALLTAAYKMNPDLALGVTGRFYYLNLADEQGLGLGADLGLKYQLNSGTALAFTLRNAGSTHLFWTTGANETYASQYCVGLAQKFSIEDIAVLAECDGIYQTEDGQTYFRAGAEATLAKLLFLRGGYHSQTHQLALGLGLDLKDTTLDYAMLSHEVLGISHQVGLSFRL